MQRDPQDPPLPDEGRAPVGDLRDQDSDLARLDRAYIELTVRQIRPVIIVWDAPVWATRYARCGKRPGPFNDCGSATRERLVPDAAHMAAWKRFVTAVAARYPKAVIETWNEPNIHEGDTPAAPTPEEMALTACAAHDAVKAVDPRRTVLSPALADRDLKPYLERMLDAGAARCWDVYSVHLYFGEETNFEPALAERLRELRDIRGAHGDHDPMWVTEAGWTTSGWFGVSPSQQADAIDRLRQRLSLEPDVDALIVHTLRDAPLTLYRGVSSPEYGYGLLRSDWTPKPAYEDLVAAQ
jgi:hypothetical protein